MTVRHPWSSEAIARLAVANAAALALLVVGWYQTSGGITVGHQMSWFEVGLVGLGVEGVSCGMWLYRGRRAVGAARAELLAQRARRPAEAVTDDDRDPVAALGLSYFHRPDCELVRSRRVTTRERDEFAARGLDACEICRP